MWKGLLPKWKGSIEGVDKQVTIFAMFCDLSENFWCNLDILTKELSDLHDSSTGQVVCNKAVVTERIEAIIVDIVHQLSIGDIPSLQLRSRKSWKNVYYKENVGLQAEEGGLQTCISLGSQNSLEKFGLMMKVMSMIYKLLLHDRVATKRDLFYEEPHLFRTQGVLDNLVDEIACMIDVPRRCLNVVATSKACLAGDLQFSETGNDFVDCSQSATGVLVPSQVDAVTLISSTSARFVLIVEKDATFQHLMEDNFTKIMPCILITGKGVPDVNVRLMVKKIQDQLRIPVFGLMDADPYGIEIMFIYKYGSMCQSWDSNNLALPLMRWIGVFPSDIAKYQLGDDSTIPLTNRDEAKLRDMLQRPYIDQSLSEQINEMLESVLKAEIQALNRISPSYLAKVYLPMKIKHGQWI